MNIRIATSAVFALASVASMAQAQSYTMQEISTGYGSCINTGGLVVGISGTSTADQKAMCFDSNGLSHLPISGVYNSQSRGVSDTNEVVGTATGPDRRGVLGFKLVGNVVTWINGFGGTNVMPLATNGSIVVGQANNAQRTVRPFKHQSGATTDLGTLPGGPAGSAQDVNVSGEIVGFSRISPSNFTVHAVKWSGSSIVDLGAISGSSWAYAINSIGDVVGASDSPNGSKAVKWANGTNAISELAPAPSAALDINSAGVAVGRMGVDARAFVNSGSGPVDLNGANVVTNNSGWTFTVARSINNAGKIVVEGTKNGVTKTFLLTP